MDKKRLKICGAVVFCVTLVVLGVGVLFSQKYIEETSVTTTGGEIRYYTADDTSHFTVDFRNGSMVLFGRENWKQGTEVTFHISAEQTIQMKVGIVPAENMDEGWGYNDYGTMIGQEITLDQTLQKLSFTVPEEGEYGVVLLDVTPREGNEVEEDAVTQLTLDIDLPFFNPIVL